jgi:hypothetical protein
MQEVDRDIWSKTKDPDFIKICEESLVPARWVLFDQINKEKFGDSIIKPINKYVEYLYPPPELISISESSIVLRQKTQADIYILNNADVGFYNIDRTWVRQYYRTAMPFDQHPDCFSEEIYKFYVPWILDYPTKVKYVPVPGSAILPIPLNSNFNYIPKDIHAIHPPMVACYFKKIGKHMKDSEQGIIKRGEPMFDMIIESNAIIEERVRSFYAKGIVSPIFR